jgi:hypothetical protein
MFIKVGKDKSDEIMGNRCKRKQRTPQAKRKIKNPNLK